MCDHQTASFYKRVRDRMRPLKLKFEPSVTVLSDDQIHRLIDAPPVPSAVRNPARRSFLRAAARGAALAVPATILASRSARAGGHGGSNVPQLFAGQNMRIFQEILADETAHVEILQTLLKDPDNNIPPRPVPHLQNLAQATPTDFVTAASAFENTGTGTYGGALFAIQQTQEYFPVATGITTVEARHAGYLNALLNQPLVPDSFPVDTSIPQSVALSHVDPFIADLNGGNVPSFDPNTPSDANNFAILDFLLLLEMVETAFYQVNVAKFFGG
jgi:hypothetical protein